VTTSSAGSPSTSPDTLALEAETAWRLWIKQIRPDAAPGRRLDLG
jgi:hypothetical protein